MLFPNNPLDYGWAERALMEALDAWAREGTAPPASRHPRFADGTMAHHRDVKFPAVPGVQWPTNVPGGPPRRSSSRGSKGRMQSMWST